MMKVKDLSGKIVPGMFKTDTGAIVIDNPVMLEDYNRAKRLNTLEQKVDKMYDLLQQLVEQKHG